MLRDNIEVYPDSVEIESLGDKGYHKSTAQSYMAAKHAKPMSNQERLIKARGGYGLIKGGCGECDGGAYGRVLHLDDGLNRDRFGVPQGGSIFDYIDAPSISRALVAEQKKLHGGDFLDFLKVPLAALGPLGEALVGEGIDMVYDRRAGMYRHVSDLKRDPRGLSQHHQRGGARNISDVLSHQMRAYLIPEENKSVKPLVIDGPRILQGGAASSSTGHYYEQEPRNDSGIDTYLRSMENAHSRPREGSEIIHLHQVSPYDRGARDKFYPSNRYIIEQSTRQRTVL